MLFPHKYYCSHLNIRELIPTFGITAVCEGNES